MYSENQTENLVEQLESIYAEREYLNEHLGVSDAEGIVSMLKSLEAQLADFYKTYGHLTDAGGDPVAGMLEQVQRISQALDSSFADREIRLEIEGDRPVIKAVWRDARAA